jgi:hypothetical protein
MPALMDIVIPRLDFLWSAKFWAVFHVIFWYGCPPAGFGVLVLFVGFRLPGG